MLGLRAEGLGYGVAVGGVGVFAFRGLGFKGLGFVMGYGVWSLGFRAQGGPGEVEPTLEA